jgi:hypothetical protein
MNILSGFFDELEKMATNMPVKGTGSFQQRVGRQLTAGNRTSLSSGMSSDRMASLLSMAGSSSMPAPAATAAAGVRG